MPTNPNMVAIQTVTVGAGGAASIDFTSIPQTYTDLKIVCSVKSTNTTAAWTDIQLRPNGSTTSFSGRTLFGYGTTVASNTDTNPSAGQQSAVGSSIFSNSEVYIPNYTSSNNKSWSTDSTTESNDSASSIRWLGAYLWSNTAAITSITLASVQHSFDQYSTFTLYGVTSAGYGAKATGGIITQDNNYFYHTFVASGTFTPTSNITADYLVVAGGGAGGDSGGAGGAGGGGAGGLRCTVTATGGGGSLESAISLTNGTAYTITVGAGGAAVTNDRGNSGSDSSIAGSGLTTITSTGGGGGGRDGATSGNYAGRNGGSGGGGGINADGTSVYAPAGTGTANQGYAGGQGWNAFGSGGGGGGGGAVGQATQSQKVAGAGGNGVATSISGSSVTYAGGGGGGAGPSATTTGGAGGTGGGGNGGGDNQTSSAGTANRGGGGGAGGYSTSGFTGRAQAGGSGIIVVRYAK